MVRPCSTISMVISPEEIRNRTVSSGNQPRLFLGVAAGTGTATTETETEGTAVFPNSVVKWHPVGSPQTRRHSWKCIQCTIGKSWRNQLISGQLTRPSQTGRQVKCATQCK